jgi:hypothetical protein
VSPPRSRHPHRVASLATRSSPRPPSRIIADAAQLRHSRPAPVFDLNTDDAAFGGHLRLGDPCEVVHPLSPESLGLLLSGESATSGGGIRESTGWMWNLTQYRPLQPFVSADVRDYLVQLDTLVADQTPQPFNTVTPEALPRALDHLSFVWKVVTGQRLFYPRGLVSAASLVEPVNSDDQLTARLGALADIFDLFTRTADGRPPREGSLSSFREQLVGNLLSGTAQEQVRAAVGQLIDITRIRNGRLHTDATNWAESLRPARRAVERVTCSTVGAHPG